jgi:hypothetical protein
VIIVKCNKCKKIIDFLPTDPQASWDWIKYWLNRDNHYCQPCWIAQYKKKTLKEQKEVKELEYKPEEGMPELNPRHPNADDFGDQGGWPGNYY